MTTLLTQVYVIEPGEPFPGWCDRKQLADFLHINMKPYEDRLEDIGRGIEYAMDPDRGGWILFAHRAEELLGASVVLKTGMGGYVPENMLLFIGVRPELRGQGIGGGLIREIQERIDGDLKLHVEHDNPALRLYQRSGFKNKYLEMRWSTNEAKA